MIHNKVGFRFWCLIFFAALCGCSPREEEPPVGAIWAEAGVSEIKDAELLYYNSSKRDADHELWALKFHSAVVIPEGSLLMKSETDFPLQDSVLFFKKITGRSIKGAQFSWVAGWSAHNHQFKATFIQSVNENFMIIERFGGGSN